MECGGKRRATRLFCGRVTGGKRCRRCALPPHSIAFTPVHSAGLANLAASISTLCFTFRNFNENSYSWPPLENFILTAPAGPSYCDSWWINRAVWVLNQNFSLLVAVGLDSSSHASSSPTFSMPL